MSGSRVHSALPASRSGPALLAAACATALIGCAGGGPTSSGHDAAGGGAAASSAPPGPGWAEPDTGAGPLAGATYDTDPLARAAAALQERLGGLTPPRSGRERAPQPGSTAAIEFDAPEVVAESPSTPVLIEAANDAGVEDSASDPALTLDDHLRTAARLASAEAGADPLRAAVLLSALHAARPDLFPQGAELPPLTPEQADAAGGVRTLAERLLAGSADPAEIVEQLAAELAAARGLRITDAALCLRVNAFGAYDPLPSSRLLAGRSHRVIVYAAIDGFSHRPARGHETSDAPGAAWAVELSEEVSVYVDSPSAMLVLHRPEQSLVEVSRAKRRDFYLVQEVTLPRTLAAGAYIVKVTVRDRTNGAQDETTIPVQIVAEPAMLTRGAGSGAP